MKKFLAFLILAAPLLAQISPPTGTSRTAGRFVAYNYGQWSMPIYQFPAGTGSKTFTLSNSTVQLGDGRVVMPFNTNAQVTVGTETVTLTAVGSGCIIGSTAIGGCSLTATFSNPHTNADRVSSATFGLQEALNDAGNSGGGAVTIDSAWAGLGGTTGIKNAATLPSNTAIEDVRTGAGGGGSGTVSPGTAGQLAGYGASGTTVVGMQNQCPFVTDPPYNSHCDGSTDDSAAIQAAMDANGCIQLPLSTSTNLQQCNVATGLVENNNSLTINLNGSILNYTGTGSEISSASDVGGLTIVNGYIDLSSLTGTPTEIDATNIIRLNANNLTDLNDGPHGYISINAMGRATLINSDFEGASTVQELSAINTDLTPDLTVVAGGQVFFANSNVQTLDVSSGILSLNGNAFLANMVGTPSSGQFCNTESNQCTNYGQTVPGVIYSAAGTPLDSCGATGTVGTAWVSDASALLPGTAYDPTGTAPPAGTDTVQVQCTYTGSVYAWQTM